MCTPNVEISVFFVTFIEYMKFIDTKPKHEYVLLQKPSVGSLK